MELNRTENPDIHEVYLEDRTEAWHIARAMGLWRYSAIKLLAAALTEGGGSFGFTVSTANLETIEKRLKQDSSELTEFLGEVAITSADPGIRHSTAQAPTLAEVS